MTDTFELTLNNPLTEEQWDTITDVDFDHTDRIWFHTKHCKEVEFTKVIRCNDCKWHKPKYPGERPTCLIYFGDWHDDDYCSRAEREEQ